jgi:hypothetical protein
VVVDSAEGLDDSPLPASIKQELAADFAEGEAVSIAVHYEVASAIADGTAAEDYAEFLEPDTGAAGEKLAKIGCDTGWRHRTRSFERSFEGFHYDKQLNSGGFTGDIDIDVPLTGEGNVDIEYAFKKTSFCLPYTVKFVQAHARAQLDVGETLLEAHGEAKFDTSDRKVMVRPNFAQSFMVGPIPVVAGAEFPIGAGYEIQASAAADLALKSRAQGAISIDVICDGEGCRRNPDGQNGNTIQFQDLLQPTVEGALTLQVDAKPYAFVEARGFLYHPQVASAGLGAELSAPTRLFYYAGNTCGTGSGPGSEFVNGGYATIGAQIEFYWNATLFGSDHFNWIDTPIGSVGPFRQVEVDTFLRGGDEHTALRAELFYADFQIGSGKHPLTPVLEGPATVNLGASASYSVKKRSCVPWDETLNYSIAWGDGTPNSPLQATPGSSASATHTFNAFGGRTLSAKMVDDVAGRSINETTTRSINVNANAKPPVPTNLSVPTSDADGNFAVTWSATVNTARYDLYRRTQSSNGTWGAWQLIASPTSASANLTSQPFGNNSYAVRACNNMGCSDSSATDTLLVGVVPSAPPIVTVTSLQCQGMNDVDWTAVSNATGYKLYVSAGTDPNNAALVYEGAGRSHTLNVSTTTRVWAKACGTGGCSGFSTMRTAQVQPGSCE